MTPQKTKIALCLEAPLAQHGGVEVLVTELVRGLCRHYELLLVSPDDENSLAKSPVAGCINTHIAFRSILGNPQELATRLKEASPMLAHFHFGGNYGWKARAFGKSPIVHVASMGIPCLSTNHGAFSIMDGYCGLQRSLAYKLALFVPAWLSKQYVLSKLVTEIAVSQNDYRNLRSWYPLFKNKFRWLYHSRIRENTPPPPNPNRRKIILCVGTIGPRKGQTFLAEAFSRLAPKFPDWQLLLIGRPDDQAMTSTISSLIAKQRLEKQIFMPGPCGDEELRSLLKEAAIFAMPSLYEGLGLSLQEAQFYGCACVGTRCGGVTDLIEHGRNGLLVEPADATGLATALEQLIGDAALRDKLGGAAAESVVQKGMTVDQMVAAHVTLYESILRQA